jgi:hypothetical protein
MISNVGKTLDIFRVMMHNSPLENKVRYDVEYLLKLISLSEGLGAVCIRKRGAYDGQSTATGTTGIRF